MDPVAWAKARGAAVLGLGVSGIAAARYLLSREVSSLLLCDKNPEKARDPVVSALLAGGARAQCGDGWLAGLGDRLIVRSPGIRPDVPELIRSKRAGAPVCGEVGLFLAASPAHLLAVTGSSGKSTVTSLVASILSTAGLNTFAGGNLGASLLPMLPQLTEKSFAVLELSSFQLMDLSPSPERAAILNISENHLNWHTGMEEYRAAKERILGESTVGVFPARDPSLRAMAVGRRGSRLFSTDPPLSGERKPGEVWYASDGGLVCAFSDEGVRRLFPTERLRLPGRHNLLNLLAAVALTDGIAPGGAIEKAVSRFAGIAHRIENVPGPAGVRCIDSSIDTTPERTQTTLAALCPIRPILLLGGAGKGLSYRPLTEPVKRQTKDVILFGRAAREIAAVFDESKVAYRLFPDFDEAVQTALSLARPGDTILLSPSCTAYDAFANFAERGDRFRALCRAAENQTK
ncbi:MAG: UDP-N-acetylmuramoyl-L-alanine--D-glutamate ligase [Clostridia bacterium]|nr:UDP-N-acetylmuramoyl-L-alanine--D-glutamate ligase [Clostridia bacterium]